MKQYINCFGKLTKAWFWDSTRKCFDARPDWSKPYVKFKSGSIVVESKNKIVSHSKIIWVIEHEDESGCFTCHTRDFGKIYKEIGSI